MSWVPIRCASGQINKSNAISHSIYPETRWSLPEPLPPFLSVSLFSVFPCGVFCLSVVLLTAHFSFPCPAVPVCFVSVPVCLSVNVYTPSQSVCPRQHQSTCVWVCVVTVHASLWDALISARRGSAPSCPCCWPLIETNQACDGPIAVTPHPSHPWPNHLLIGPRRAPSRWHRRLI